MDCPRCGSRLTEVGESRVCPVHGVMQPSVPGGVSVGSSSKVGLFLSYGRRDAKELADRLRADLERCGYEVWEDTRRIRAGRLWEEEILDGLRSAQVVVALLSPHAVRRSGAPANANDIDSVCLDEITFARFSRPPKPIVPVMAEGCDPPFCIFRLEYVDMCAWRDREDCYRAGFERLLEAIAAALKGEVRYRWWEPTLKPWDFTAFIFEKRRYFCGRRWLFDEIDAWRRSQAGRALLITGDPGIGKSAVVAQLVHLNPGGQVLAYHCCQAATSDTLDAGKFVRSVAAMIASKLVEYADMLRDPAVEDALREANCASDPGSAFERGILAPLEHLHCPESGVRYILIDALDESLLRPGQAATIVDVLASRLERLPRWLRIVATTRRDREVLDRLAGLHAKDLSAHDPRNLEDLRQYTHLRLSGTDMKDKVAATGQSIDRVLRILLDKSEGSFLYVQQVLEGIERGIHRFDDLAGLSPGLSGLYLEDLLHRFPDETAYALVRRVLEVLVAAQEPLAESMLALSTGMEPEQELPRFLRALSGYLRVMQTPSGESGYSIYHTSFCDWLTDPGRRGTTYYVSARRGQERLAEACWEQYRAGGRGMSGYALEHLPTHLAETGRFKNLLEVVRNTELGFIRQWVEEGKGEKGLTCLRALIQFLESQHRDTATRAGLATQVARIHSLRGEYDKAEERLGYALRHTSWWRGRRARAVAMHELGSLHLYKSEFPQAKRFYRRALRLSLWPRPVYHDEAAANLIGLATVSEANNSFVDAVRFASRGIGEARKAHDSLHIVAGKRLTSAAYRSLGKYEEAGEFIEGALLICEIHGVRLEMARLLLLMGWLKHDLATLKRETLGEAKDWFERALIAARQIHDLFCAVEAEISLCWHALSLRETGQAALYLASLRRSLSPQLHPQLRAGIEVASASEIYQRGRMKEARELYQDAISFCGVHQCNTWKRRAMVGLGATFWHTGDADSARKVWDETLDMAQRSSEAKRTLAEISIALCRQDPLTSPR